MISLERTSTNPDPRTGRLLASQTTVCGRCPTVTCTRLCWLICRKSSTCIPSSLAISSQSLLSHSTFGTWVFTWRCHNSKSVPILRTGDPIWYNCSGLPRFCHMHFTFVTVHVLWVWQQGHILQNSVFCVCHLKEEKGKSRQVPSA